MASKRKAEPEERCPKCGCPELLTFARQTSAGFRVVTSCPGCSYIVPAAAETETELRATATPEIRPGCTEPDYYEPNAVKEEAATLVALLRAVQLEHSRGFIELSKPLERSIIEAIGPHPRDGDG